MCGCCPYSCVVAVLLLVEIEIVDQELYDRYIEQVPDVVYGYGGRYVSRSYEVVPIAGGWEPDRVIIIEFPDMDALIAFGTSAAYQRLAELRERSTRTRSLALPTLDQQPETVVRGDSTTGSSAR